VPGGWKDIETIGVGDQILSRDENDPGGRIEAKVVEEVFARLAPILHVHLGGQVIRTTAEHPFFHHAKGWLRAGDLAAGDWVLTEARTWVAVTEIFDTGEWERVYNLRVAEWHTYFVGRDDWGFAVWVHNAYIQQIGQRKIGAWRADRGGNVTVLGGLQYTSDGHGFRMMREAVKMGRSGKYTQINMNRGLNYYSGRTDSPNLKPDVGGVRKNGRIDLVEVPSPKSQTRQNMEDKLDLMRSQLPVPLLSRLASCR